MLIMGGGCYNSPMKLKIDKESDTLYFRLDDDFFANAVLIRMRRGWRVDEIN
jgi:hypothetical protein